MDNSEVKVGIVYCMCSIALCYMNRHSGNIWIFAFVVGFYCKSIVEEFYKQRERNNCNECRQLWEGHRESNKGDNEHTNRG